MLIVNNFKIVVLILSLLFVCNNKAFSKLLIEDVAIGSALKKSILNSSLKANLKRNDGKEYIAYLYAKDEKSKFIKQYITRKGEEKSYLTKTGNYYIYLYDSQKRAFLPQRIKIFREFKVVRFNFDGAGIFVLPSHKEKKSDVLFISQFGDSSGDFFEAYGFSSDNAFVKNYSFLKDGEKDHLFYGQIAPGVGSSKINAYVFDYDLHSLLKFSLFLSKNDEIMLQPNDDWESSDQ